MHSRCNLAALRKTAVTQRTRWSSTAACGCACYTKQGSRCAAPGLKTPAWDHLKMIACWYSEGYRVRKLAIWTALVIGVIRRKKELHKPFFVRRKRICIGGTPNEEMRSCSLTNSPYMHTTLSVCSWGEGQFTARLTTGSQLWKFRAVHETRDLSVTLMRGIYIERDENPLGDIFNSGELHQCSPATKVPWVSHKQYIGMACDESCVVYKFKPIFVASNWLQVKRCCSHTPHLSRLYGVSLTKCIAKSKNAFAPSFLNSTNI